MSGSGWRSKSASTRAASAPCRTRVVSARAPSASPSASMSRLLPGPGLAGQDVEAAVEGQAQSIDEGEVGDRQLEEPTDGGHDGRSSTLWRSRSQNDSEPSGAMSRIG